MCGFRYVGLCFFIGFNAKGWWAQFEKWLFAVILECVRCLVYQTLLSQSVLCDQSHKDHNLIYDAEKVGQIVKQLENRIEYK